MALAISVLMNFAFLGTVCLVGLFAFERAMLSQTWRCWLYLGIGMCCVVVSIPLTFIAAGLSGGSVLVTGLGLILVAAWQIVREISDHALYRDTYIDESACASASSVVFRSRRDTPVKAAGALDLNRTCGGLVVNDSDALFCGRWNRPKR